MVVNPYPRGGHGDGYLAPANKRLLLLLNGALAKRGVRRARREGKLPPR